jgi:uncharacterized membrane protein
MALRLLIKTKLQRYFLAGLLAVVPISMTVLVVRWTITLMDQLLLRFIPQRYWPEALFGFALPGIGLLATFLLILLVGVLVTNYFGRSLLHLSERIVGRIPLVKGIFGLFKQVADTVLSADRQGFRKVVLIEYPRRGLWSVGFVTGFSQGEVQRITDQRMINVFMPTTPNPTSGYYILVPEEDARELKMSVDEAFKLIISGGMVSPPERRRFNNQPAGQTETF